MTTIRGGSSRALFVFCTLLTASGLYGPGCNRSPEFAARSGLAPERQVMEKVLPAVVRIEAIRLQPNQGRMVKARVGGSGAIISAQGHVLTNYHVADDADYYRCYLTDGSVLNAECVGLDALTDLAVLQLDLGNRVKDAPPLPVAVFGDSDRLAAGEPVLALGSPASLAQSVTRGIVSNAALVLPERIRIILDGENVGLVVRWVLHDASIFPGNSGGPLVNRAGEIVGINEIGVANLGGAIPGNLARSISGALIAHGHVTRGWSGLTVQPRLEADGPGTGVVVADIAAGSPSATAGLQPGDVVLSCNGELITGSDELAVANFNRLEMASPPGAAIVLAYSRGAAPGQATITLAEREPALHRNAELRTWGAIFRDLTRELARDHRLPDTKGVWVENIRPGGPSGQAEPELARGDVLVSIDSTPIANLADLRKATTAILAQEGNGRSVLATVRRDGNLIDTVVDLRITDERHITPVARRAWVGVAVQPLTRKLATRLGVEAGSGVRVTRVHAGTRAAEAGLLVGDIILKIDDQPVTARRAEDQDTFARQIRQYSSDTEVTLGLWRNGATTACKILLEKQPIPAAEMASFVDDSLELTVRELAFEDRARLLLPTNQRGLIVESTIADGWASVAGLRADDLLLEAGGVPLTNVTDFRTAREQALQGDRPWWLLRVERKARTLFVEVNLKPLKS